MRHQTFRLITLGRVSLVAPDGSEDASLTKRRRKLALFAVLALAGRPLPRSVLAEMFWGDQDEERARHSLSDALSHLRRVFGRDAIASRQSDVWIAADADLAVDAAELTAAAAARDAQRVTALYAGPFLDGVYVEGSATFEHWVARERDRLERLFVAACESRCMTLARSRAWDECAELAVRWLNTAPLSVDAALYRLNALKAPGTRDAYARALAAYEQLGARLRDEYELAPDARVSALAADIAVRLHETPVVVSVPAQATVEAAAAAEPVPGPEPAAPRRVGRMARWLAPAGVLGIALVLAAYGARYALARPPETGAAVPVVAVAPIRVMESDGSSAWLGDGVAQLVASDLAAARTVTVVPPERVHEALASLRASDGRVADAAGAAGRAVGATWVVDGGLAHGDTMYVLDVSVHDVESGKVVRLFTVTAANLEALASRAASRLLSTALPNGAPVQLACDVPPEREATPALDRPLR